MSIENKVDSIHNHRGIMSVLGPVLVDSLGLTDAHNHLWIDPVIASCSLHPTLIEKTSIITELQEYQALGGKIILDCQPGGCGRNGAKLAELSQASHVQIIACTGFHLKKYYPPGYWLWDADSDAIANHFLQEIETGLSETRNLEKPVKAGFIKIACEETLAQTYPAALSAALEVAIQTGYAIMIHTEKGAAAELIADFFLSHGISARKLVFCHMDKRPDFQLHKDLARADICLEYDTFYRPKYEPEKYVWPLIGSMIEADLGDQIALGTDMAEVSMWKFGGGNPGLAGFLTEIHPRLKSMGLTDEQTNKLMGMNILSRLVW